MSKNDRYVVKHPDGWAVKAPSVVRAIRVHNTQKEAEKAAKKIVLNAGGGEVRIQGRDGKQQSILADQEDIKDKDMQSIMDSALSDLKGWTA